MRSLQKLLGCACISKMERARSWRKQLVITSTGQQFIATRHRCMLLHARPPEQASNALVTEVTPHVLSKQDQETQSPLTFSANAVHMECLPLPPGKHPAEHSTEPHDTHGWRGMQHQVSPNHEAKCT